MTSKDKLIYIDELLQKTYSDTLNYSVITSNIEDILIDLDRLEKLEKVIDILRDKIIIYQFDNVIDNSIFCTLETEYTNKTISKEECELLRSVFEDDR